MLEISPADPVALQHLSDALKKKNRLISIKAAVLPKQDTLDQAAAKELEEALRIDPNDPFLLSRYADYLRQQEKLDEAAVYFEKALKIDPKDPFTLSRYAVILDDQDKTKDALSKLEEAYNINGKDPYILTHLANLYFNQDQFNKALALVRTFVSHRTKG